MLASHRCGARRNNVVSPAVFRTAKNGLRICWYPLSRRMQARDVGAVLCRLQRGAEGGSSGVSCGGFRVCESEVEPGFLAG